jgi:hypothetical protein
MAEEAEVEERKDKVDLPEDLGDLWHAPATAGP